MSVFSNSIPSFCILFLFIHMRSCIEGCVGSERDALLLFKNGLSDPSHRLADWVVDGPDCCRWAGVVCHNITAHVVELHLRNLSPGEYLYDKTALGGKVSSSLLQLIHLSYLDLSYNNFGGVAIPKFIGSMQSLKYLNLSGAGFGGMIPPQLGNLSNLQYLDLAGSISNVGNLDWVTSLSCLEFLDLSHIDLRRSFDWLKVMNSLPSLLELHLSDCSLPSFNAVRSLPNLNFSSLAILDLSSNLFGGPIPNILHNITYFLRELDLSYNQFNSIIPKWLYDLTHLELLNLQGNNLHGQLSSSIENLTSLVSLDLSYNVDLTFERGIPKALKKLCRLRSLDLSFIKHNQEMNDILEYLSSGCVSDGLQLLSLSSANLTADGIGHYKNLRLLSVYPLADSVAHGPISTSFKHLCNLRSLYLSGVRLNQEINDVLAIISGCVSNGLQAVVLNDCKLSGHLTDDVRYLKNLIRFDISDNLISGAIPSSLGEMKSLMYLYLRNNTLNGSLPASFGNLNKLERVSIAYNDLEGEVSELHFTNLTRLSYFDAPCMGNSVALRVSSKWIPPLQLEILSLRSWNIGSQFPKWLLLLKLLRYLDLSNSGISTPFPIWFCDSFSNYDYLNVSHNQMHGSIPNIFPLANGLRPVIDLSSNKFSGALPYFSSYIAALDLSNNSFSGSIRHFLCHGMQQEKEMQALNLERNLLSGEIPDCWRSWKYLVALKLSNNMFRGRIPNSIGTLNLLQSLHLRNNNLSGKVPSSIKNCKNLFTIDFSENNLVGNIPTWMGDGFAHLSFLSLHSNKLNGYLPKELCHLVSLHILDLSHNSFYGPIPSCFSNFTGMATEDDSTGLVYVDSGITGFIESNLLIMKGKVMEYSTNLGFVRSLDLSNNNLSGEIPTDITTLTKLLSMNLSHNALTGRIPNNIGDMKALEAVDFSHNKLSGEIPQSMSILTFLSILDLSYNNLSGRIPSGTQLQSFNSSSFIGNKLCGPPLTKNCSSHNAPPAGTEEEDENGDEVDVWFYGSMAFGFVLGFGSGVGSLIFIRRWRHLYFHLLNKAWEKIWWSCFCVLHWNQTHDGSVIGIVVIAL